MTRMLTADLLSVCVILLASAVVLLLGWVAAMPGTIAQRKNHPHALLIRLMGWASLIVWPLWIIAYLWAKAARRSMPMPAILIKVSDRQGRMSR